MNQTDPQQAWSRFRFSVIGSLLSSPPQKGELQACVRELAQKTWRHLITNCELTSKKAQKSLLSDNQHYRNEKSK